MLLLIITIKKTKVWPKGANMVVATQAISKLRSHLNVELMAVLNVDADLHRFDFHSTERTFQLLTQLKQMTKRKMLIQTQLATSRCLILFEKGNREDFYLEEMKTRKELSLPPFAHFVAIIFRGKEEERVIQSAEALHTALEAAVPEGVEVLDLHPDVHPVLYEKFRFVILLKGKIY